MQSDAYILIGGRSSRMGRDKATLSFGETTLAEHAAAAAQAALPDARVTFVATNAGQFPGPNVICDIEQGRGPLGGFHAALTHAEKDWMLLIRYVLTLITIDLNQFFKSHI